MEKQKKNIVFITGLHNKPQGCGASVASAVAVLLQILWTDPALQLNIQ
jgi:hypothetical protein